MRSALAITLFLWLPLAGCAALAELLAPPQRVDVQHTPAPTPTNPHPAPITTTVNVPGENMAGTVGAAARVFLPGPVGEGIAWAAALVGGAAAYYQRQRAAREAALSGVALTAIQQEEDTETRQRLKGRAEAIAVDKGMGPALALRGAELKARTPTPRAARRVHRGPAE